MTDSCYHCSNTNRLQLVKLADSLNGLEYVEVDVSQTTLSVHFAHPLPGQAGEIPSGQADLTKDNFEIAGGVRVPSVSIDSISANGDTVTINVLEPGDFSLYTLKLVAHPGADKPPAGFDPALASIAFSFKINCPNDFDCATDSSCSPEIDPSPTINYLARDYQGLRRVMMDRLRQLMPGWNEDHAADNQVAMVELVAYLGDYLSYYQDGVTTEAYLGSSRKRASVRRHTRLLDYRLHDGCNARTWIALEVEAASDSDGETLPAGTSFITPIKPLSASITNARFEENMSVIKSVFESLHDLKLHSQHNKISFYTWSDQDCCLPAGATQADLDDSDDLQIETGDALLFEQHLDSETGSEGNGDVSKRHAVRVTEVERLNDPLDGAKVLRVTWHAEDALPFPLPVSGIVDNGQSSTYSSEISVARANIVLAAHGRTKVLDTLAPDTVADADSYGPRILSKYISFSEDYDHSDAQSISASAIVEQDPRNSLPIIDLDAGGYNWNPVRDLMDSYSSSRAFVVETDDDGTARLRFGDGIEGRKPEKGLVFSARAKFGNGVVGNIGRESISTVIWEKDGVLAVRNPLPGQGGIDAETIAEAKRDAPEAFKTQERAVTEDDYAEIAARHAQVQKAHAQFRWTGSWHTAFVSVDRVGGLDIDDDFKEELAGFLNTYRLAGYDIEIVDPQYLPLELELFVCVKDGASSSQVREDLYRRFSSDYLSDGSNAFFHPDEFTFGDKLYLSRIYEEALKVDGVSDVSVQKFRPIGETTSDYLDDGLIEPDSKQVIRLDNDPNYPENGTLAIELQGGL